jgi:RsiW-degrading membrane proteinase PrsW (M82 family)
MDLWSQMTQALQSWFKYPNVSGTQLLIGFGIALAFGVVWLIAHWPPLFKRPWFWAIAVVSALVTMVAFAYVRTPLQFYYDKLVNHYLSPAAISDWLLLLGIPSVIISGLVQEGGKMVPMAFFWWKEDRRITPAMGLAIGAMAGAAFGIFEAFQVFGTMFGHGWTTAAFSEGFDGIAGFWERFFAVGFHTAISAMVGFGLARGKGWQYFLVAAGFHALFNYPAYFYAKQYLNLVQVEVIIAVIAVIITAVVLIVRYRLRRDFPGDIAYDADQFLEYELEAEDAERGDASEATAPQAAPETEPPAPEEKTD